MPDGVTDGLTRAELRDLVGFLCQLGKPGPFRVPTAPLVRVWETLAAVPENLQNLGDGDSRQRLPEIDPASWQPHYSAVSGELPASELPAAPGGKRGLARFAVEVVSAGQFRIKPNTREGLSLWIDNNPAPLGESAVDLPVGPHVFVFAVDLPKRGGAGLSCAVEPASPGAEAKLRTSIK